MTTLKDCADACMHVLNEGKAYDVFINPDSITVKCLRDPQEHHIQSKNQLKAMIKNFGVRNVDVEYDGTRAGWRFWIVYPSETKEES